MVDRISLFIGRPCTVRTGGLSLSLVQNPTFFLSFSRVAIITGSVDGKIYVGNTRFNHQVQGFPADVSSFLGSQEPEIMGNLSNPTLSPRLQLWL